MLNQQDVEFLRGLSIFAGLRDEVVQRIGEQASRLDIAEDQPIFREGEPARDVLVVLDGQLDVIKHANSGQSVCIASLGPGDVAGAMSLFDIQPRAADLWARAPASVAVLDHASLAALYRQDTPSYTLLVLNIARELSIRLRRLDTAMANALGQMQAATLPSSAASHAKTHH